MNFQIHSPNPVSYTTLNIKDLCYENTLSEIRIMGMWIPYYFLWDVNTHPCINTEMEMLSFWWNFHHWLQVLEWFLWNCSQLNDTELAWWLVNIGSGNGLALSGNKLLPKPMLI